MASDWMGRIPQLILLFLGVFTLQAQTSPTTIALDSVIVSALKISKQRDRTPFSVTKRDYTSTQDQRQQLSLASYLQEIPGVFTLNTHNFAQDLRVAVRGFGSRAAFGIRGIKLIVDGIPQTTPDGQGQIDNLNLGLIESVELIRGGAASLYGNASGGVIAINTLDQLVDDKLELSYNTGSFGYKNYQFQGSYQLSKTTVTGYLGHVQQQGYRDYSSFQNLGFNLKVKHQFEPQNQLTLIVNYAHSPEALDPGGITAEAVSSNRRQARQRNVDFESGESVDEFKLGASWKATNKQWSYESYGFYTARNFLGRLPFAFGGIVDLARDFAGLGGSVQHSSSSNDYKNRLRLGLDMATQNDLRRRFVNLEGGIGEATLDQNEQFSSLGLSLLNDIEWNALTLFGGVRYDTNSLGVEDRFLSNGDDSDRILLDSWNYSLGLSYQLRPQHRLFVNSSSSYETPVLSELSANPTGQGGFNTSLQPQQANTYELGYGWQGLQQRFNLTLYHVDSWNELVPYELESSPGRSFFRNAGRSLRRGIESSYSLNWDSPWKLSLNYTYSDFRYKDYQTPDSDFSDNTLPGLPPHLFQGQLLYQIPQGLSVRFSAYHRGLLYGNDANTATEEAVTLLHIDAATPLGFFPAAQLFVGIQNLTDARYSDNLRLNAFGNRFYEPAPGRSFYGGVRIRL